MPKVQVEVVGKLPGRHKPGDVIELKQSDARMFKKLGRVRDYTPPRRGRPGRETTAEVVQPSTGSAPTEQPPAQPAGQEPGHYGRRDMQPEE